jgi:hypothetical protein
MASTRISGTVWSVFYRHKAIDPKAGEEPYGGGQIHIVTADPTGRYLFDIARQEVLAQKPGVQEFTIMRVERATEVFGVASVAPSIVEQN